MKKQLTAKCGNCADSCLLNFPEGANLNYLYCKQWSEITTIGHSCTHFQDQEAAKHCFIQDFKTRQINKHPYPLNNLEP